MGNGKSIVSGEENLIGLTGRIVAAYAGNNSLKPDQLPVLMQEVYAALSSLAEGNGRLISDRAPAVPIANSLAGDHIICLEDGKKLTMLKRYLRTHYDLSPEEYRRKWGLPADYPMVAKNYAKKRSQLAKDIGLGRLPTTGAKTKRKTSGGAKGKRARA